MCDIGSDAVAWRMFWFGSGLWWLSSLLGRGRDMLLWHADLDAVRGSLGRRVGHYGALDGLKEK